MLLEKKITSNWSHLETTPPSCPQSQVHVVARDTRVCTSVFRATRPNSCSFHLRKKDFFTLPTRRICDNLKVIMKISRKQIDFFQCRGTLQNLSFFLKDMLQSDQVKILPQTVKINHIRISYYVKLKKNVW